MCATENPRGADPKAVERHSVFEQGLAEHWVSEEPGELNPKSVFWSHIFVLVSVGRG